MSRTLNPLEDILQRFDSVQQYIRQAPLSLGGSSGSGGGSGGPPGGFLGRLPQTRVTADTTESFYPTSGSFTSLLDNLNQAREWLKSTYQFFPSSGSPPAAYINISSGSWYHTSGQAPLVFSGGQSPNITAPSSGSRFSLLTINTSGVLSWTYGTEGNPPDMVSFPATTSGSLPVALVLARSSGSVITKYDSGLAGHYLFRTGHAIPLLDWGTGGAGGTSGSPPGDWMNNAGDVLNWQPTNVRTVGTNGEYSTIQSAHDAANAGDLIIIGPETITESFVSVTKQVSIVGLDRDKTRVLGRFSMGSITGPDSLLSNMTVQNNDGSAAVDTISGEVHGVTAINSTGPGFKSTAALANTRRVTWSDCIAYTTNPGSAAGFHADTNGGNVYLYDCETWGYQYGALAEVGNMRISSGSFQGTTTDLRQTGTGTMSVSGARWRSTSGSINFLDWPRNFVIVAPERGHYTSISTALANMAGFASASNPVTILVYPGTYFENLTIGDYLEVVGIGERSAILNGIVTMNGTRSALARMRIAPEFTATAVNLTGGSPLLVDNAIVPSSGSCIQATAGTPVIKSNSFAGSQGINLQGGTVLMQDNFHNSGNTLLVNGATASIDDWMDALVVTAGMVTLGQRASAASLTVTGGTVSIRDQIQLPQIVLDAGSGLDLTTSYQDATGLTETFTPKYNEKALVHLIANINQAAGTAACNADDALQFVLNVNGSDESDIGQVNATGANGIIDASRWYSKDLTGGTAYTIKMRIRNGTGNRGRMTGFSQMMIQRLRR